MLKAHTLENTQIKTILSQQNQAYTLVHKTEPYCIVKKPFFLSKNFFFLERKNKTHNISVFPASAFIFFLMNSRCSENQKQVELKIDFPPLTMSNVSRCIRQSLCSQETSDLTAQNPAKALEVNRRWRLNMWVYVHFQSKLWPKLLLVVRTFPSHKSNVLRGKMVSHWPARTC